MNDILVAMLLLTGAFFSMVAAIGVLRFKDFYARIHAATKASTFGLGFTVMAAACHLGTVSAWAKAIVAMLFLFLTLPVSAHLLGRAYRTASGSNGENPPEPRP